MNTNTVLKVLLAALLLTAVLMRDKIGDHLGLAPTASEAEPIALEEEKVVVEQPEIQEAITENPLTSDDLYRWDDQYLDWVPVENTAEYQLQLAAYNATVDYSGKDPIQITWPMVMDINYELRYFSELDMEVYAPVFPEAIKALDGKEVIIEGFVIPIDEEANRLALSANPYASCFFCGKSSPASVMSMYLKNDRKRYRMDDFKTFKGTLHLNHSDPNEFYYILRDTKEE